MLKLYWDFSRFILLEKTILLQTMFAFERSEKGMEFKMNKKKFNKCLTIVLIFTALGVSAVIAFYGFDVIKKVALNSAANSVIDDFNEKVVERDVGPNEPEDEEAIGEMGTGNLEGTGTNLEQGSGNGSSSGSGQTGSSGNGGTTGSSGSKSSKKTTYAKVSYDGYNVVGKIKIPKTGIEYPVLDEATVSSMQRSVGIIAGPGLNQIGNTVIMGHNYKNGTFFSDNEKIENGDVIYITGSSGKRRKYIVYNKYLASPSDFNYAVRKTNGTREITLVSCTDEKKNRVVIWAKEA